MSREKSRAREEKVGPKYTSQAISNILGTPLHGPSSVKFALNTGNGVPLSISEYSRPRFTPYAKSIYMGHQFGLHKHSDDSRSNISRLIVQI